jgi:archaellum component FlaC
MGLDFHTLIVAAKVLGTVGVAAGILWKVIMWSFNVIKKIGSINENVEALVTNHLPHIQESLDAHGASLSGLKSDVRDVNTRIGTVETRLEDTRRGVHTLGDSFLRHLEDASKERREIQDTAAQVKKDLDTETIAAIKKIVATAETTARDLAKKKKRG